jgi:hypothetical protein
MDAVSLDVLKFVQVLLGRGWHWCEHDAQLLLHPVDHDLAVRFEADRLLASPELEERLKLIITSPISKGRYWR